MLQVKFDDRPVKCFQCYRLISSFLCLLGLVDEGNWESTYGTAQKKFTSHVSFPAHYAILVARNENHVKKDFVDG